jgi:predicted RNase H-like HicB family nuclease
MLIRYMQKAMEHAHYELLSDDGSFYGEISECPGVYANADTLEKCRTELEEVLEEWVLFRIYKNLSLPAIEGVEIKIRKEVAA